MARVHIIDALAEAAQAERPACTSTRSDFRCTLDLGHDLDHVAHGTETTIALLGKVERALLCWSDEEADQ